MVVNCRKVMNQLIMIHSEKDPFGSWISQIPPRFPNYYCFRHLGGSTVVAHFAPPYTRYIHPIVLSLACIYDFSGIELLRAAYCFRFEYLTYSKIAHSLNIISHLIPLSRHTTHQVDLTMGNSLSWFSSGKKPSENVSMTTHVRHFFI